MKLPKDQPFWTSVILHLVVLVALFLATIIETLKPRKKPHVFEMVTPAAQQEAVETPAEVPPAPEIPMPELPSVPEIAPVPKPIERPPEPAPPEPAPPKPKVVRYEDFLKENPIRDPKPRRTQTRKPVDTPRIEVPKLVVPSNPSPSASSPPPLTQQQMSALGKYSAQLRSRIDAAWAKPASLAGVKVATTVIFDVSASGRVTNARLRPGSGNAAFDQSVLAAFRKVISAGPTPTGQEHSFTMTFRMTD